MGEISKSVCLLNTTVVCGFSVWLTKTIQDWKELGHTPLPTPADRNLTPTPPHALYARHNFTYLGDTGPTLSYYVDTSTAGMVRGSVVSRRRLQKHKLKELFPESFDPDKTEQVSLYENGIHPVYNSGCHKYTLYFK